MPGLSSAPFQRIPTLSDPSHPTRATDHPPLSALALLCRIWTDRTEAFGAKTVAGSMYAIRISLRTIIHDDGCHSNTYFVSFHLDAGVSSSASSPSSA